MKKEYPTECSGPPHLLGPWGSVDREWHSGLLVQCQNRSTTLVTKKARKIAGLFFCLHLGLFSGRGGWRPATDGLDFKKVLQAPFTAFTAIA